MPSKRDPNCAPAWMPGLNSTTPGALIRRWPAGRRTRLMDRHRRMHHWRHEEEPGISLARPPDCPMDGVHLSTVALTGCGVPNTLELGTTAFKPDGSGKPRKI